MSEVTKFWDREIHAPTHVSWLENADVRYVNHSMTGSDTKCAIEWLHERYPDGLDRGAAPYHTVRLARAKRGLRVKQRCADISALRW